MAKVAPLQGSSSTAVSSQLGSPAVAVDVASPTPPQRRTPGHRGICPVVPCASQGVIARGFWLRLVLALAIPLAATLTWLAIPADAVWYFAARLATQGAVLGMVVAVFLNHAAPIKELGHVPASCHAGVVLGYTLLAPAGAIIGVYWWGTLSPDAVYLGIIAAHLVMWPLATWQVPRRFVPTKRDEPDKMPSGGSVSCADATDSDAESLPTEPKDDIPRMKRQRWSNLSTTSAGQSESSYNSTLVVRAITLRIGWVMLLLALQLRFCINVALWQDETGHSNCVGLLISYRLGVWFFKYLQRLAAGRHSGLFPAIEYSGLLFAAFPLRVIVVSVGSWDVYFSLLAFELVYKLVIYPVHLSTPVQRIKGSLVNSWMKSLQHNAARMRRAANTATPRALRDFIDAHKVFSPTRGPRDCLPEDCSSVSSAQPRFPWRHNDTQRTKSPRASATDYNDGDIRVGSAPMEYESPRDDAQPTRLTTRDVEEAGPHPAEFYTHTNMGTRRTLARVLFDEQGFAFSSAYDRKRLSTKFFFSGVIGVISVVNVLLIFLYLRSLDDSAIAHIDPAALHGLYIKFAIAVVFDIAVLASVALASRRALRDQNGFFPVVHGSKECIRIAKVMLVMGIAVNLVSFTSFDFSRAPEFTGF